MDDMIACPDCHRLFPARDAKVPWHRRLGTGYSCGPTPWVNPLAPRDEEPQPVATDDPNR